MHETEVDLQHCIPSEAIFLHGCFLQIKFKTKTLDMISLTSGVNYIIKEE